MAAPTNPERARQLRRRHRRERQAVVFGGMVAAMAVAGLGAAAVYTGVVEAPFAREFTTLSTPEPTTAPPPCPPEGTLPVVYAETQVRVLNGTGTAGLAGEVGNELVARGFAVQDTENFPGGYAGMSLIRFGQAGLGAAYTLAAHVETPVLELDLREDATVDLVLGSGFTTLLDPTVITLSPDEPLAGAPGCVPLDRALQTAPEGPPAEGEEAEPEAATADGATEEESAG
ncbi:MAG: LytR C-terminal domain-containing protein [Actinotalea sp.]|nr:LytR C-terminal domain-containing protein [Actinotalea sp.]